MKEVSTFLQHLEELEVQTLQTGSTHQLGHTLDAVIFRDVEIVLSKVEILPWTDHSAICFLLIPPARGQKRRPMLEKSYFRSFKMFPNKEFSEYLAQELEASPRRGVNDMYISLHQSIVGALDNVVLL